MTTISESWLALHIFEVCDDMTGKDQQVEDFQRFWQHHLKLLIIHRIIIGSNTWDHTWYCMITRFQNTKQLPKNYKDMTT